MGLKATIYEYCQRCGEKDAEVRGNTVWHGLHKCQKAPPGPKMPPHDSPLRKVHFVPGQSTPKPICLSCGLPMFEADRRPHATAEIAKNLQHWLDFHEQDHKREGIATTDDSHIISPPVWPTRGTIKAWIKALTP